MTNPLHIRSATQDDLPKLLALYMHLTPDNTPLAEGTAIAVFQRFERYTGSAIFIGLIDTVIVSSCTLVVIPNLTRTGAPYALIENVVTHEGYRKQGFGRSVLKHAVEAAWDAGCYKTMLLTGSNSPATLSFYKNAGFSQSKTGFQIRRIAARPE